MLQTSSMLLHRFSQKELPRRKSSQRLHLLVSVSIPTTSKNFNQLELVLAFNRRRNQAPLLSRKSSMKGINGRKLVMIKPDRDTPVATAEGHLLHISAGYDPCLMICFCAISDEMVDDRHRGRGGSCCQYVQKP